MTLFVRLAVAASFAISASVAAQSPRFTFDLGEGNERTSSDQYALHNRPYWSAVASYRVGQFRGFGLQVVGSRTSIGDRTQRSDDVTCATALPNPYDDVARCNFPFELSGDRTTIGLAVERAIFPLLSLRGGASFGWFNATESVGSSAHAYPLFGEAIVPLTGHLAAFATLEWTYLHDLAGKSLSVRANWYGLRLY